MADKVISLALFQSVISNYSTVFGFFYHVVAIFSHLVCLFIAPLPNLTSDDIDRALAPASTQGPAYVPASSVYDSRQHPVITSNPNALRGPEFGQSPRYTGSEAYDRTTPTSWTSSQQTPSKLLNYHFFIIYSFISFSFYY